jgi:hypothetical protein
MVERDPSQIDAWLRDGIAAAKAGRTEQACELLLRVIENDQASEVAWLWLSGVVDSDEDRLVCLENVLTLNPDNAEACAGVRGRALAARAWRAARGSERFCRDGRRG